VFTGLFVVVLASVGAIVNRWWILLLAIPVGLLLAAIAEAGTDSDTLALRELAPLFIGIAGGLIGGGILLRRIFWGSKLPERQPPTEPGA
jgi:hypothetical protein